MKPIVTAIGICTLLLVTSNLLADSYVWIGGSSDWRDGYNWDVGTSYPGENAAGDTGTINVNTNMPVTVSGTVTYDVAWVKVDAETADASLTLQIASGGNLDVLNSCAGYIWLIAGTHMEGETLVVDDATLQMTNTDPNSPPVLRVDDIICDGGERDSSFADNGKVVVDIASGSSITIKDDVSLTGDIEFGGSNSFSIGDTTNCTPVFEVGDGTIATEMRKTGSGTITINGAFIARGPVVVQVINGLIETAVTP